MPEKEDSQQQKNIGYIIAIQGSVVDVRFEDKLPAVFNELRTGAAVNSRSRSFSAARPFSTVPIACPLLIVAGLGR